MPYKNWLNRRLSRKPLLRKHNLMMIKIWPGSKQWCLLNYRMSLRKEWLQSRLLTMLIYRLKQMIESLSFLLKIIFPVEK
jgi:hypothetical protein